MPIYGGQNSGLTFFEDYPSTPGKLEAIHGVPIFEECTLISMEGIVNLLKHAIPVGMIYNLGRPTGNIDLMVVLERNCTTAYAAFENVIDLTLLGQEEMTCTIHNYGLLNAQLSNGHVFYNRVCVPENLIYRKNSEEIFRPVALEKLMLAKEQAAFQFNLGIQKAIHFYNGAQFYLDQHILDTTMFMLHQSCELTFRCLLNTLRGKDIKCHSPAVLRKHIKRFAPEMIGIFSAIESEELYYLQLLEDAYIQSRYQLDYDIDSETVLFLNERIGILQKTAMHLGNSW